MKQEIIKEIENVLVGKSGEMKIKMVDDVFSLESTGTFKGKFKLLMFAIGMIAEQEGISYLELLKRLESMAYPESY